MLAEYTKKVENLAKPFLGLGIYDSPEKFLKDVIEDLARNRIRMYEKTIKAYKDKYGSFEKFTKRLEGKAKPKAEDKWMEWEVAKNMLEAWKKAMSELGLRAS